jgi:hexosaminidase
MASRLWPLLALLACSSVEPPAPRRPFAVIPRPVSVRDEVGEMTLGPETVVVAVGAAVPVAEWFAGLARPRLPLPVVGRAPVRSFIELVLDPAIAAAEGYRLEVTTGRIEVRAQAPAGLFYGLQTLRLLLPPEIESTGEGRWTVPALVIEDAPRFPHRGMMLDVSRSFFPVTFVERIIEVAALFKMNRFHWHLTDDQGWRLPIARYPRLTEATAQRSDGQGGSYTQEEIREVVRFAAERFVTVIPEIELPGHCMAALAAYPALACTSGPFTVPSAKGIYDGVLCPSEDTFVFLEGVLDEVTTLFPGPEVHIGGDEVVTTVWQQSPVAQEVIAREGLPGPSALGGYFVGRVAEMLRRRGRQIIGWDEILAGPLPAGATVMSWRGVEGGIAAARAGHDVVMTPSSVCYLEHYQADPATEPSASGKVMPLGAVYAFDPVPAALTAAEGERVRGSEAVLWTEHISTADYAEYMAYPRAFALAERLWSPAARADYRDFLQRLQAASAHLDALGVNYATHFRRELSPP